MKEENLIFLEKKRGTARVQKGKDLRETGQKKIQDISNKSQSHEKSHFKKKTRTVTSTAEKHRANREKTHAKDFEGELAKKAPPRSASSVEGKKKRNDEKNQPFSKT